MTEDYKSLLFILILVTLSVIFVIGSLWYWRVQNIKVRIQYIIAILEYLNQVGYCRKSTLEVYEAVMKRGYKIQFTDLCELCHHMFQSGLLNYSGSTGIEWLDNQRILIFYHVITGRGFSVMKDAETPEHKKILKDIAKS